MFSLLYIKCSDSDERCGCTYWLDWMDGMMKNILACAGRGSFGLAVITITFLFFMPPYPRKYRETIFRYNYPSFSCTCSCVIQDRQTRQACGGWLVYDDEFIRLLFGRIFISVYFVFLASSFHQIVNFACL